MYSLLWHLPYGTFSDDYTYKGVGIVMDFSELAVVKEGAHSKERSETRDNISHSWTEARGRELGEPLPRISQGISISLRVI